MRAFRVLTRVLVTLVLLFALLVGTVAATVQTAWFRDKLRRYVIVQAGKQLNGELSIGRLSGDLFHGIGLSDVAITVSGERIITIREAGIDYNLLDFVRRGIHVDRIHLTGPTVVLHHDAAGWSMANLLKKQDAEADREGPLRPFGASSIVIDSGSIVIDDDAPAENLRLPERVEHLDARMSFEYEPVHYALGIDHLSFTTSQPEVALRELKGSIAVRDDAVYLEKLAIRTAQSALNVEGAIQQYLADPRLNLQVGSSGLALGEVAAIVPGLTLRELHPAFTLHLDGPLTELKADLQMRSEAGDATASITGDFLEPDVAVSGRATVRQLDLATLLADPAHASDINGDVQLDLKSSAFAAVDKYAGRIDVHTLPSQAAGYQATSSDMQATVAGRRVSLRGRAAAYDAQVTTLGTVVLPVGSGPTTYDLRGSIADVNLRRWPATLRVPPATTSLHGAYHVTGSEPGHKSGQRIVRGDVTFKRSTVPGATIVDGSRAAVRLSGDDVAYSGDATVADLDLEQVGRAFEVPALAQEKYRSNIDAHVTANGRGTSLATLTLSARGQIDDAQVLGAHVTGTDVDLSVERRAVTVNATGTLAELDPAVASERPELAGNLHGQFTVEATVADISAPITPERVDAEFGAWLTDSTMASLEISSSNLVGGHHGGVTDVRWLDVSGPDLSATATGPLALGPGGESALEVTLDSRNIEPLAAMSNVPLMGMATVKATVRGNRDELRAEGTLSASRLQSGDNGALSTETTFTATLPELDTARARVDSNTRATFVTLGGQEINEITLAAQYADRQVAFETLAKQPKRSLDASGAVVFEEEGREVQLTRLAITTEAQTWSVPDGERPTIRFRANGVDVEHLRLTSGAQSIEANGEFGSEGEPLQVVLTEVELANVDAMLLRDPQFTGRLNASAVITGTTEAPRVEGQLSVVNGAFRQFTYESLDATVDYQGPGLTVDATLHQDPTQWLTATGYVPAAAFAGNDSGSGGGSASESLEGDRIDLKIDSSPLGLGLIQGFTTAVTDVTGVLEAHVAVTGTARDPRPKGAVTISNGALNVPAIGVNYTNIAGRVDLEPDRVHIDQLTVLDNHQSALNISGELAVQKLAVGGVQLYVNAEDFKVLDNESGNVRVQSAMEIDGDLKAPVVTGYFGVTTGRIDLDKILEAIGDPLGATAPTTITDDTDRGPRTPLDALRLDVHVTVPGDLIIRARDLRASDAVVSLGALNVTLGGDLTVRKEPGESPRLLGDVTTVRGTYDFQGRRFEILRDGSVHFTGEAQIDPILDLRTKREIQGVEARVNVKGRLSAPEIQLSSSPPLEDADILSLIVFNQPINQLGAGEQISLASRAQALAAGTAVSQLSRSLGGALNLDTFEIAVPSDNSNSAEVTLGQQVSRDLYVKLTQNVGETTSSNFVVEYELLKWLRLQSNLAQGDSPQQSQFRRREGSGVDLILLFTR